ncbi:MAG: hypothetical protein ACYDAC_11340 [Candidatus Dormibacteria bacterium]
MSLAPRQPSSPRLSRRGWTTFAVAAVAVVVAAVVGVRGLLATPIVGTSNGITTISGTWEPYSCNLSRCQGYVTAGARSVFVVFPPGCPGPSRAVEVTVQGRRDATLGSNSYRAISC